MDVILLQYFLDENDNDMAVYLARNLTIFALLNHKRFIPRINNYAENIVPLFDAALFRSHFRVTPAVYDIILREVQGYIVSKHGGGTEQIEPSKQLLIFLAYMAGQESLREISVQFGVGIKTVHDVVKSMSYAINTLLIRVSINELENDGPRPWIPVTYSGYRYAVNQNFNGIDKFMIFLIFFKNIIVKF